MRESYKKAANILQQEHPLSFNGTPLEIAERCLIYVFLKSGYEISEHLLEDDEEPNIEFCEKVYEQGFAAIINDGVLLGFKNENAP